MSLEDKARKLIERAEKVLNNTKIPPNERDHQYCDLMLRYATVMAMADTAWATRWNSVCQEWNKRKQVALAGIANDRLEEIWASIERIRSDSETLKSLE